MWLFTITLSSFWSCITIVMKWVWKNQLLIINYSYKFYATDSLHFFSREWHQERHINFVGVINCKSGTTHATVQCLPAWACHARNMDQWTLTYHIVCMRSYVKQPKASYQSYVVPYRLVNSQISKFMPCVRLRDHLLEQQECVWKVSWYDRRSDVLGSKNVGVVDLPLWSVCSFPESYKAAQITSTQKYLVTYGRRS